MKTNNERKRRDQTWAIILIGLSLFMLAMTLQVWGYPESGIPFWSTLILPTSVFLIGCWKWFRSR